MGKVFIAFSGFNDQNRRITFIKADIQVWNLKSLKYVSFLDKINEQICPSINNLIKSKNMKNNRFEKCYKNCNWGILFDDNVLSNYDEIYESLLAMQLFSGIFLPVMFYITEYMILIENDDIEMLKKAHFHNIDRIFHNGFINFYNIIKPSLKDTNLDTNRMKKWNKEQFRICTSLILFNDLKKYQNSKKMITWQKECSEMVTIYENLLSRGNNDNGYYKISQRIEILLGNYFKNEKMDILMGLKKLFNYRNDFIHGSFFQKIQKYVKKSEKDKSVTGLPDIEWQFLNNQMKILRLTLISFLYLSNEYKDELIPELIYNCIMDTKKRKELQEKVKYILNNTKID